MWEGQKYFIQPDAGEAGETECRWHLVNLGLRKCHFPSQETEPEANPSEVASNTALLLKFYLLFKMIVIV